MMQSNQMTKSMGNIDIGCESGNKGIIGNSKREYHTSSLNSISHVK